MVLAKKETAIISTINYPLCCTHFLNSIKLQYIERRLAMIKTLKRYTFVFAIIICMGIGINALASTVSGNIQYNGTAIGKGILENNGNYGSASTKNNSSNGRYGFVSVFGYNKSGSVISSGTDTSDFTAVKTIYANKARHYRGTHAIKKSSNNQPLKSITLYAY